MLRNKSHMYLHNFLPPKEGWSVAKFAINHPFLGLKLRDIHDIGYPQTILEKTRKIVSLANE
jgi:hypothetical protein